LEGKIKEIFERLPVIYQNNYVYDFVNDYKSSRTEDKSSYTQDYFNNLFGLVSPGILPKVLGINTEEKLFRQLILDFKNNYIFVKSEIDIDEL